MLRFFFAVIVSLSLVSVGWGDDNKEKRAAAQFLFEKEKARAAETEKKSQRAEALFSAREVAPVPLPSIHCDCHQTASCHCAPGGCSCCADDLPDYEKQAVLAKDKRLVIVAYFGTKKGNCFDGAVSAGCTKKVESTATIHVGYGDGARLLESEILPVSATREQIVEAIQRAGAKRDTATKSMPAKSPELSLAVPATYFAPMVQVCRT